MEAMSLQCIFTIFTSGKINYIIVNNTKTETVIKILIFARIKSNKSNKILCGRNQSETVMTINALTIQYINNSNITLLNRFCAV